MYLYLCNGTNDIICAGKRANDIEVQPIYRHNTKLLKWVDKFVVYNFPASSKAFLGKWTTEIDHYDVIIIEALKAKKKIIEYIHQHASYKTRVILWHWNTIFESSIQPNDPICKGCELWSFDPEDCRKYGMHFNTQYYDSLRCEQRHHKIEQDVWFVGADKGRLTQLRQIQQEFEKRKISHKFHITKDGASDEKYPYKKSIPYCRSLKELIKSKAVLDVPKKNQNGLTLRPLEAMFHQKKLITTNAKIKSYDFYCSDNIFVIGEDSWESLADFINSPFNTSVKSVLQKYDIVEWMHRF